MYFSFQHDVISNSRDDGGCFFFNCECVLRLKEAHVMNREGRSVGAVV